MNETRAKKTQKLLEKKSHEHIISGRNDKSNKFPFYLNKKFCLAIKNVGYVLEANCFKGNLFDFIVSLNHFRTVLFSCLLLLFTFIHNKCWQYLWTFVWRKSNEFNFYFKLNLTYESSKFYFWTQFPCSFLLYLLLIMHTFVNVEKGFLEILSKRS